MSKCCVHASVGKPRGAISRDAISHAHVRAFTWHLLRCHMTVVWLDEQQMSPSGTMPADSIGCIINQSGLASFSCFLWSELYCHLLLRSTPRRRVVCPIRKLPTWLTLVGLITRVFDPLPVARTDLTCEWELLERICRCFLYGCKRASAIVKYKRYNYILWSI